MTPPPLRLAVCWPRLGPYHLARLRATHARLAAEGGAVVALETASRDALYDWQEETAGEPFSRVTALPGRVFDAVRPAEMAAAVTAALDRIGPDAVAINSYSVADAQAALLWCRRHRRTAVLMTDTTAADAVRTPLRERAKGALVRQFDAALVAGAPHREYLADLGFPPDRVFQPYDVVDNAFFRDNAARARADPGAWASLPGLSGPGPFFLASSRFVPRKNVGGLLRAYGRYRAAEAAAGRAPWRLVVLGDGPERPALGALAERAGGVTLAGFRQAEELPAYYGLAGAFVHAPLVDQWGLVVNEAMASGLPVAVSDRAGCARDLVHDGDNGVRFDPADEGALAQALALVAAPGTDRGRMGRRSAEIVAAWSPEAFADGVLAAARSGAERADRSAPAALRLALRALHVGARSARAFHAVRD